MIKIINICVFLDYSLFRLFKNGRCQNPEMAGICRNITVYPGISRYIPEFREICRNFAEYAGIARNMWEYHGILRFFGGNISRDFIFTNLVAEFRTKA
jgi:hypothetical protein